MTSILPIMGSFLALPVAALTMPIMARTEMPIPTMASRRVMGQGVTLYGIHHTVLVTFIMLRSMSSMK